MRWIKIFIGVGAVALVFFISLPFLVDRMTRQEEQRFRACERHQRVDCDASAIWDAQGWTLPSATSTQPSR
jgi:hypothetical protein